jgi:hypothetical protein
MWRKKHFLFYDAYSRGKMEKYGFPDVMQIELNCGENPALPM